MSKNKVSLKAKLITLAILPFCLPFMLPGLLKHIFYSISLITEAIGAWFGEIDFYFASKSKKFFKWVVNQ
jgi:hypothetical protein